MPATQAIGERDVVGPLCLAPRGRSHGCPWLASASRGATLTLRSLPPLPPHAGAELVFW